jgi:hypothetical protein
VVVKALFVAERRSVVLNITFVMAQKMVQIYLVAVGVRVENINMAVCGVLPEQTEEAELHMFLMLDHQNLVAA